ncbi:unnamed protein product, partial [marine sediment metagenome]
AEYFLGLDIGSVSIKLALLEGDTLAAKAYLRNQGLIPTIQQGLKQMPGVKVSGVGVTGSGKEFVSSLVGGDFVDSEVISHMIAALKVYPDARTIMDVGGEDSKLMLVKNGVLSDFQMNSTCGAGSGAMVETIASRLGYKIEDVGKIALESKEHLALPQKCGIFMQSEVVSQLNKGRAASDILMGVCRALTSNYLMLAKGKKLLEPVIFQGAVAKNKAVVKAFEEALNCPVIVPEYPEFAGAVGIALLTEEQMNGRKTNFRGDVILAPEYRIEVRQCPDPCPNECELT